jgi:hypothetical protein
MAADTSAASEGVPEVVLATARARVEGRRLGALAGALAAVLLGQVLLLGFLTRRPYLRLYVPDTTLVTPFSYEAPR